MIIDPHLDILHQFVRYAELQSPHEACALLGVILGKPRLFFCRNLAEHPEEDFLLSPADFAAVSDLLDDNCGDLVGVMHSHPKSPHIPTPVDRVGCENSGLPWYIYSLVTKEWTHFSPNGYRAPLVGRQFKHGVFDCYSALRDWYKENRGISIRDFDRQELWWKKGDNLFMDNFMKAGFMPAATTDLQVGDVILMNMDSSVVNHCAIYLGNDRIFHQLMNRLSCRQVYGGMFKKNTRLVLRYVGESA